MEEERLLLQKLTLFGNVQYGATTSEEKKTLAAGAQFMNGIIATNAKTTDTISFRSKVAARMSDVTKAMDETYSKDDKTDEHCV